MKKKVKLKSPHDDFFSKNQRGQFYLIAAIIIISLLVGFVAIVNYSKKTSYVVVEDLRDELKIESQKVLNYDTTHEDKINQFGIDYSSYLGSDVEVYFITGSNPQIQVYQYINKQQTDFSSSLNVDTQNDLIILTLDSIDYEFDLMSGDNFYFLLSQEIKGERFVETG